MRNYHFFGYTFNIEPRFTDRLHKGVKVTSQKGLQVFWPVQYGDEDCHQVRGDGEGRVGFYWGRYQKLRFWNVNAKHLRRR